MQKAFNNFTWENLPSTNTALEASRLNGINNALDTVDDRVVGFDTTKANQSDMLQAVKTVTFSEATGTFRFTFFNGTYVDVDTDIEKIAVNFDYDDDPTSAHFQQLVITLDDGTVKYVDMSALVTQYDFTDSSQIHFSVVNGNVTATVINGSITENMLQPNFLADCRSAKAGAESAESGAEAKALVAEGWATGTQNGTPVTSGEYYHNNAKYYKEQAEAFTPTGYEQLVNDVEELKEETAEKMVTPTTAVITDGIATFNTIDESYLKGLVVDIEPVQDLHGYDSPWVGGAGKNKYSQENEQGSMSTTGENVSANNAVRSQDYIAVNSNTTYTLSASSPVERKLVKYFDSSKNYLSETNWNASTFTTPANCAYIRALFQKSDYNINITPQEVNNVQLELGSTVTDFEPYSNISPISGHTECMVEDVGFNKWDEEWEVGSINPDTGANETNTGRIRTKNHIEVEGEKSYYFKCPSTSACRIAYYDSSKSRIGGSWSLIPNTVFTTPTDCAYIRFSPNNDYGTTYNNDICINISDADKDGTYVPYRYKSITIPFGQTVYGGTLDVIKGELVVDRAEVDLGTLTWTIQSTSVTGKNRFRSGDIISVDKKPSANNVVAEIISSNYKAITAENTYFINDEGVSLDTAGAILIYDSTKETLTAEQFKTAVNGFKLVYTLATPTTIQLTPQQIKTLLGENNISASTGDVLSAIYTAMMTSADVETQIDALNIDDLQSAVADLQDDVSDIADDITAIDTRVTILETNANKITWSSSVNALVDDTTATISDSHITVSSIIEPFYSNSSGDNVVIKNMVATTGQVVLTFDALLETTSFKVRITNL